MDLNKRQCNDIKILMQRYFFGIKLNQADKCVYRKFDNHGNGVIICLYVDNLLIIFVTDLVQVQETKDLLSKSFQMKYTGRPM